MMTNEQHAHEPGRRRVIRLGATVLAVAALAACGSSGDSDSSTATTTPWVSPPTEATSTTQVSVPSVVDPCTIVSREEAEQLAGTPLDPGEALHETCTYSGPIDGPVAQVEIYIGAGAKKFLDIDRELGHTFPVEGLGEEAYAKEGAIFFRRGTVWATIHYVTLRDPAEYAAALESLARVAVTRI